MQSASPGFRLSRQVAKGEVIDFFVSHSWSDGPERKWRALQLVAEMFYAQHGRYPTFWVDKFCIDQRDVADGLRVLPVNVMACRKAILHVAGDGTEAAGGHALQPSLLGRTGEVRLFGSPVLQPERGAPSPPCNHGHRPGAL
ncbi:unnamed protein product [Symbiodinium sp. KB8]|nr:unnamed protein product [Symbiodinium sp. KB8]